MNSVTVKARCPHCGRERDISASYNGGGIIQPFQVRCEEEESYTIGCKGYFTIQGRVVTTVETSITAIPMLADALKQNGNGKTVPAEGVGA